MSKALPVKVLLSLLAVTSAAYEPEPKPERIVVAACSGYPHQAEKGKLAGYWQSRLDKMLAARPDLILAPEGSDQYPGVTDRPGDPAIRELFRETAKKGRCFVAFPTCRDLGDGRVANSIELFDRDGKSVGIYDKNFPTPGEIKMGRIVGKKIAPWQTALGKIAPLICWDLNFYPDFSHYFEARPQLILFASRYHGGLMQRFWAYECRSYFIGAFAFGECTIINPVGEVVARSTNYTDVATATINLDYQVVHLGDGNMARLRKLKEKYGRGVTIFDPGHLGPVLVTSELKDISSARMIEEFGIAPWDEFYRKCREEVIKPR